MLISYLGSSYLGSYPLGVGQYFPDSYSMTLMMKENNLSGNANFIDPITKDYIINMETGEKLGCNSAQQLVYLRLFTAYNSSILEDFGIDIIGKVVNERTAEIVVDSINKTLKDIIDDGTIQLINVDVQVSGENVSILIEWKDISNNTIYQTVLG